MKSLGVAPAPTYSDFAPTPAMATNPSSTSNPAGGGGLNRAQSYATGRTASSPGGPPDPQLQAQLSAAHIKVKQLEDELSHAKAQIENLQKRITLFEGDQDFLKQLDEENAAQAEEIKLQQKEITQKTALLLEKDLIIEELQQKVEELLNPRQHITSMSLREKEKPKGPSFKGSEDNLTALLKNLDLDDI